MSIKPEMTRVSVVDDFRQYDMRPSCWTEKTSTFTLIYHGLNLCLIGGAVLLAAAIGAAALASGCGFLPLPPPLALIDLRLPIIFRIHMMCGGVGLMLFPWVMLFRRRRTLHRFWGRLCLGLLLASALAALPAALASEARPMARLGFMVQGSLTLYCLAAGFQAIRHGDPKSHRHFMVSVAAILSGVALLRVMLHLATQIMALEFDAAYAVIAWTSWGIPFLAVQLHSLFGRANPRPSAKTSQ